MLKELPQAGNTIKGYDLQKNKKQNKTTTKKNTKKPPIKTVTGSYLLIITLNVNRKKNASMKRHRLAELMEKQNPYI